MARQVSDELIYRVSIRADGSQKTIKELEDQLKLLKAEVKSTQVGSMRFAESIKEVTATQKALGQASKELDTALGKQTKSLGGINESYDFQNLTLGELKSTLKNYKKELLDLPREGAAFDSMSKQIRIINDLVKGYEQQLTGSASISQRVFEGTARALQATDIATNKTVKTTAELNILMRGYTQQQKNLETGSKEWDEVNRKIHQTQEELKNAKTAQKQFFDGLNTKTKESQGLLTQMGSRFKESLIGIPGFMAASFSTQAVKEMAGEVVRLVGEFDKLKFQVASVTDLGGEELNNFTANLKGLSDTFGVDFKDLMVGVNSVSKQFGITSEEALNLVQEGFLKGANSNDEYLKILKEYPAQFKAAGQSAEEFIALTAQGAQQGVFDDKAIDTVKEFSLRIREQTLPVREALINAFGKPYSDQILNAVNVGTMSSTEALKEISKKLNETELTASQSQTVLADVFGAAGEDAGIDYIKSLQNVETELDNIVGAGDTLIATQRRQLESQQELQRSVGELSTALGGATSSFGSLKNEIAAGLISALAKIVSFLRAIPVVIRENQAEFIALGIAIAAFNYANIVSGIMSLRKALLLQAAAIRTTKLAQLALNATMKANPVGFVIGLIATLAAGAIYLYRNFEDVRAVLDSTWAVMKSFGTTIKDIVVAQFNSLVTAGQGVFGVLTSLYSVFAGIGDILSGNFTAGIERMKQGFVDLKKNAADTANSVVELFGGNLIKVGKKGFADAGMSAGAAWSDSYNQSAMSAKNGAKEAVVAGGIQATAEAVKQGAGAGAGFNAGFKKEMDSLSAELRKLRLEAMIELAGDSGSLARIEEEQRQALAAQREVSAFRLLSEREQNALLNKINAEFLNKKVDAARAAVEQEYAFENETAEKAVEQRLQVELQAIEELRIAARASGTLTPQQDADFNSGRQAAEEASAEARLELAETTYMRQTEFAQAAYDTELNLLNDALMKQQISREQHDNRLLQLNQARAHSGKQNFETLIDAELNYNQTQIEFAQRRAELAEEEEAARMQAAKDALEKRRALYEMLAKDDTLGFAARIAAIKAYYALEQQLAGANAQEVARLEQEKVKAINEVTAAHADTMINAYSKIAETTLTITDAISQRRIQQLDDEIAQSDQRILKLDEDEAAANAKAENAVGRRGEILKEEVKQIQERNLQEVAAKTKLEDEKEKQERKAAAVRKAIAITQGIIDTARAILGAIAVSPATVGQPWVSIIAAVGVAQQAAILATKFQRGGTIDGGTLKGKPNRGGFFKGRSHAAGGIKFAAGGRNIEVEGDEIILNRNVYRNPATRAIASDLNVMTGGVAFAKGGVLRMPAGGTIPTFPQVQDFSSFTTVDISAELERLGNRIEAMKPVVSVSEINSVNSNVQALESAGSY